MDFEVGVPRRIFENGVRAPSIFGRNGAEGTNFLRKMCIGGFGGCFSNPVRTKIAIFHALTCATCVTCLLPASSIATLDSIFELLVRAFSRKPNSVFN